MRTRNPLLSWGPMKQQFLCSGNELTLCDRLRSPPQHKEQEGSGDVSFVGWVNQVVITVKEMKGLRQIANFTHLRYLLHRGPSTRMQQSQRAVCMYVFITVCVRMRVRVCHRSTSHGVILHDSNHFGFWRQGLSLLLRTPDSVRLADKWDLGTYWFPPSQHWDYKHMQIMGTELRFSGMQIEPFSTGLSVQPQTILIMFYLSWQDLNGSPKCGKFVRGTYNCPFEYFLV